MYCTFANGMFRITELTKAAEMQLKITINFQKLQGCAFMKLMLSIKH